MRRRLGRGDCKITKIKIQGFPITIEVEDGRRIIGWPDIDRRLREAGDALMERAKELQRQSAERKKAAQEAGDKQEDESNGFSEANGDVGATEVKEDSLVLDWDDRFFDPNFENDGFDPGGLGSWC
jgi:hypothetical protein